MFGKMQELIKTIPTQKPIEIPNFKDEEIFTTMSIIEEQK